MSPKSAVAKTKPAFELELERVIDAPRERVWEAWSKKEQIARWFAPRPFQLIVRKMDLRKGGSFDMSMRAPDGAEHAFTGTYTEVSAPSKLSWIGEFTGMGPAQNITTVVTFEAVGKKTKVRARQSFNQVTPEIKFATQGAKQGWTMTLDQLAEVCEAKEALGPAFEMSRTFDCPRELMFRLWTEPEHLARWFSPKGVEPAKGSMDFRPGGSYHYGMKTPDGKIMWGKWTFREIVRPEKVVLVSQFSDEKGGLTRHPMAPDWPRYMLSTFLFTEAKGKTTVTISWAPLDASDTELKVFEAARESMKGGWGGTFAQLEEFVPTAKDEASRTIGQTRLLDAPRELVWKMFTDPKHVANWWGPNGFTNTIHRMEVRPGGRWDLTMHGPDGTDYKNESTYVEVLAPERLVFDHHSPKFRATIVLEDQGGKTLSRWSMLFASLDEKDLVVKKFKADEGLKQNLEKLADYLRKQR